MNNRLVSQYWFPAVRFCWSEVFLCTDWCLSVKPRHLFCYCTVKLPRFLMTLSRLRLLLRHLLWNRSGVFSLHLTLLWSLQRWKTSLNQIIWQYVKLVVHINSLGYLDERFTVFAALCLFNQDWFSQWSGSSHRLWQEHRKNRLNLVTAKYAVCKE